MRVRVRGYQCDAPPHGWPPSPVGRPGPSSSGGGAASPFERASRTFPSRTTRFSSFVALTLRAQGGGAVTEGRGLRSAMLSKVRDGFGLIRRGPFSISFASTLFPSFLRLFIHTGENHSGQENLASCTIKTRCPKKPLTLLVTTIVHLKPRQL